MRFLPSIIISRHFFDWSTAFLASSVEKNVFCISTHDRLMSLKYCILKYGAFMCCTLSFMVYNDKSNMRQQSKSKTLGIQPRKGGAVPTLTHHKHL